MGNTRRDVTAAIPAVMKWQYKEEKPHGKGVAVVKNLHRVGCYGYAVATFLGAVLCMGIALFGVVLQLPR